MIVNYNTRALLRRCLETVFASAGVTFCVCVVDNASADGSAAMVAADFPQVLLIANADNPGYPTANNQGLRALGFGEGVVGAPCRHALLLNPDTEVPPTAFAEVVQFIDAHPAVGVVGPKLVRPDGSLDRACRRSFPTLAVAFYHIVGLSRLFPRSRRFARYNLTYLDPDQMAEVDSVVGAFMLVRGAALAQVGLLDEAFFMYGEDLDWAYRIKAADWQVIYYPAVTVLHVKRAASRQNPHSRVAFWRAMEIFYRKHYAEDTPRMLHALVILTLRILTWMTQLRVRWQR